MAALLAVERLVKTFPVPHSRKVVSAVNDVTFTLDRGETLALVGESGSGKTTVGRCIVRLLEPGSGRLVFDGRDVTRMKAREFRPLRARMQVVFQEPYDAMDPRMTIGAIIQEPLRALGGAPVARQMRRVVELMRLVYLDEGDVGKYPHELSASREIKAHV